MILCQRFSILLHFLIFSKLIIRCFHADFKLFDLAGQLRNEDFITSFHIEIFFAGEDTLYEVLI